MNRCVICDYTEEEGSALLNTSPSKTNRVHDYAGEPICNACEAAIEDNYAELSDEDDEVDGS